MKGEFDKETFRIKLEFPILWRGNHIVISVNCFGSEI